MFLEGDCKSLFYVAMTRHHQQGGVKTIDVVGHFHSIILIFSLPLLFLSERLRTLGSRLPLSPAA
jgi:hypothetical protein